MSISKIRENARVALTGKWGKGACIVLAYLAVSFAAGFIIGLAGGEETALGSILDLAYSIIQVPIMFGLSFALIKLKRNEEVKAFDFLNLGFSNFARAWKIGLREVLKILPPIVLMLVSIFVMGMGRGIMYSMEETSAASAILPSLFALLGLALIIISTVWMIVRSLSYSLTTYIAYDNPDMHSLDVVNESARMMKGNRLKIFLLSLSFIGWIILAAFTLGIGYLWLLPYMEIATICFYEHLLGKNEVISNEEHNVEAITEM